MAPKALPPAAKQILILKYLRASNTVHTLKELEKALPSIASINGMQVKEYIQALSDESQIRVEKIGSGNWYWSFVSEEKKAREGILYGLREEKERLEKGMEDLKVKIGEGERIIGEDGGRAELVSEHERLKEEVGGLEKELEGYSECDPGEIIRKKDEIKALKVKAQRWTDNIYCLEEYLAQLVGGDKETLETMKRQYYGDEFVEGEGLREL